MIPPRIEQLFVATLNASFECGEWTGAEGETTTYEAQRLVLSKAKDAFLRELETVVSTESPTPNSDERIASLRAAWQCYAANASTSDGHTKECMATGIFTACACGFDAVELAIRALIKDDS